MATKKQILALKKMGENGGNASKAMKEVGYSPAIARNPQKLTKSKGFMYLCKELGLTDEFIVSALVEDIKNKPGNRRVELALAARIVGLMKKTEIEQETDSTQFMWASQPIIINPPNKIK